MQNFRTETENVTQSGKVGSVCQDITFYNNGTTNVTVSGIPLIPGGMWGVSANAGEQNLTQYDVVFSGVGVPSLLVIRKKYV